MMTPPWLFDHRAAACAGKERRLSLVFGGAELFQRHVQHQATVMMPALRTAMSITQLRGHLIQHAGHLLVLSIAAKTGTTLLLL